MGLDNRDPRCGEIARVGGHRRQPVLNPAMHKASDAGHIGPHGMRRCLSSSYRGRRHVPPTRARRPKNGSFLKSVRCAYNIANTVKNGPWEGLVWGKGRNPNTAKHHEEMDFLVIFE